MTELAIFDLDRTLTIRPTYSAFLIYAARHLSPWRLGLLPLLAPHAAGYAMKRIPRRRMKEAMHAMALGKRVGRHKVEAVADSFAEKLVENGIFPQAQSLFAKERQAGRRIVLATAAPALYVEPLAHRLKIDDVIATRNSWHGDVLLSDISEDNCYAACKQHRIAEWLEEQGIARNNARITFYSDHASDLPTFEWVDEPVAVNPSKALATIARARGWRVLDWRAEMARA
ncbi:HAD-IB family hydrolase [Altererythrobacter indicus]|uniref:HAD-IB family hydrolase n=1 Tax=Altericroceibacterium indicum TaxID=374177 RepID=A0A845ACM4_9SPHN|nr:HAD-IB family hydrolase [Altericroceibacterium indicum]MXP26741.1 HAD-IB family hydrolase [Altericroceibacterium indicum]